MRIVTFANVCCLVLSLMFAGCSPVVNAPGSVVKVEKADTARDARKAIERRLAEGSLAEAYDVLREALRGDVTETALADIYIEVENRLLDKAARVEGEGRFDEAGRVYRMALDLYPKSSQLQSALVMRKEAIRSKIDGCANELMKSGLVAYREGELAEAVAVWEKIAPFYPDYSPSEVAIKTAKQQIENLERLAPSKTN
jgi:tetratricopeptide (TPR) repeat protein